MLPDRANDGFIPLDSSVEEYDSDAMEDDINFENSDHSQSNIYVIMKKENQKQIFNNLWEKYIKDERTIVR